MQNVLLIVHLILAIFLIGVVLLQRSEGGALGIGGGGGGAVSGRSPATAMTKLTWVLGAAFIATSITLTILGGGRDTGGGSIVIPDEGGADGLDLLPPPALGADDLLPPPDAPAGGDLTPPAE